VERMVEAVLPGEDGLCPRRMLDGIRPGPRAQGREQESEGEGSGDDGGGGGSTTWLSRGDKYPCIGIPMNTDSLTPIWVPLTPPITALAALAAMRRNPVRGTCVGPA
jgi:hypothetical protein